LKKIERKKCRPVPTYFADVRLELRILYTTSGAVKCILGTYKNKNTDFT